MNTTTPLYKKVYNYLSNQLRRNKLSLGNPDASSPEKADNARPTARNDSGTESQSSEEPRSGDVYSNEESGEESGEYEQVEQDSGKRSEVSARPPTPRKAQSKKEDGYDEETMWFHLTHPSNPIVKAKAKVKKYKKLLAKWRKNLHKVREDIAVFLLEEDEPEPAKKDWIWTQHLVQASQDIKRTWSALAQKRHGALFKVKKYRVVMEPSEAAALVLEYDWSRYAFI